MHKTACLMLAWALLQACAQAYVLPFDPFPHLEVSGSNTLSFNLSNIEGSSSFYRDDNIDRDGTFTHSSNLYVTGALYKDLYVNATFLADRYAPNSLRWNLRYDGKHAKVMLGEFGASLTGNDFVTLSRSIKGVQVDTVLPRGNLTFVTSMLQAPVRTDTFYGKNISGPYYLTSSPIVDGSEVVLVNDVKKERIRDYTIDYSNGILTFTAGIIIGLTDRVNVSYEVESEGMGGGRLYGIRANYPLFKSVNVGLTHLMLDKSGGTADGEREARDDYLGDNTPGPYTLSNRPIIVDSERVTVNGVLVPKVTDTGIHPYTLDYEIGKLLFSTGYEPPMGSTIIVRYRVFVPGATVSDRTVTGLDMNWVTPYGVSLNVQAAQSEGAASDDAQGNHNTALSVATGYTGRRLSTNVRYRDVGQDFSPLEAVGYRNVERQLDWSGSYALFDILDFTFTGNNAREPLNPYLNGAGQTSMREETRSYGLNFHPERWPTINLQHSTYHTGQPDGGTLGNDSTTDSLSVAWLRDTFSSTLSLNRSATESAQQQDPSNPMSIVTYAGVTDSAALNLTYQPNDRLDLTTNLAVNRSQPKGAATGGESSAQSSQVSATYRAAKNLTFSAATSANRTSSTQNVTGSTVAAQSNHNLTLNTDWRPLQSLAVGLGFNSTRSEGGDDSSNSTSNNYTANLSWTPWEVFTAGCYWSRQNLSYLGATGSSVSNMVGANMEIGPFFKITTSLDGQHLWGETLYAVTQQATTDGVGRRSLRSPLEDTEAPTVTGNRLTSVRGRMSYPIAQRHSIFITGELTRNGGFPSQSLKESAGLGWDYRVTNNVTFTVNAGRVVYTDDANEDLNYRANQMNAQLSWHF